MLGQRDGTSIFPWEAASSCVLHCQLWAADMAAGLKLGGPGFDHAFKRGNAGMPPVTQPDREKTPDREVTPTTGCGPRGARLLAASSHCPPMVVGELPGVGRYVRAGHALIK
ncbi:hypothetical protein GCM10022402_22130 [Salinactinospora qingdaonensis]|uniref:Uncharacterized protein n=1 Tax=Salinactinospora qingdaonensis TaxID=702744 RepID=A0ABP7FK36_9ACTN